MSEKDMKERVLLIKAANNFEAGRIEAALRDEGIPVFFKFKESGIFGIGPAVQADLFAKDLRIDMFVAAKFYDRARDILIGIGAMDEQGESTALTDLSGGEGEDAWEDEREYSEEEYRETLKKASKIVLPSWAKKFLNVILCIIAIVVFLYAVLVIVYNFMDLIAFLRKVLS